MHDRLDKLLAREAARHRCQIGTEAIAPPVEPMALGALSFDKNLCPARRHAIRLVAAQILPILARLLRQSEHSRLPSLGRFFKNLSQICDRGRVAAASQHRENSNLQPLNRIPLEPYQFAIETNHRSQRLLLEVRWQLI